MAKPSTLVHSIHSEDFDGVQFERLVFAYHWRSDEWCSLEWYGQVGSDFGRDIWGVRVDGTTGGEPVCIQCVNRKQLTFAKAEKDIGKVLKALNGVPYRFRIVAQCKISATLRDRIKKHVKSLGVQECDTWSGPEFEGFLRKDAESLLKRFVEGEPFPDAPEDLRKLAESTQPLNDDEVFAAFAKVFDRPAFYTPIHQESNLGDFKQAMTDTIQALGTGIWKTRDGHVIDRIPSRRQLKSDALRTKIQAVKKSLSRLRAQYDEMIKSGVLRRCMCSNPIANRVRRKRQRHPTCLLIENASGPAGLPVNFCAEAFPIKASDHSEVAALTPTPVIHIGPSSTGNDTVEHQCSGRPSIALFKQSLSRDPFVIR